MSIVNTASDIFADMISGTVGPIAAAGASLAEQTFTDNTVEELKANNEKYNDFLNYAPRTEGGKEANQSFKDTIGEGAAAVVDYYKENEEDIPDSVKSAVSSAVDTWNDLDEETRFALGNLATVAEVLPMGKAASLAKKGIDNATDARRISNAASEVPDESAYLPVQERLGAMGARQEMAEPDQQPIVGRKKKDYPTKEEWQEAHGTDLKQKRITEVKEAAAELQSGSMSVEDYDKVVSEFFPIKPITEMPELPTLREIDFSLKPKQVETGIIGSTKFIEDGTMVASRLDINAYERYDTWVVSLHDGNTKSGLSIGHGQTAVLKDVNFTTITKAAVNISQSKGKATIARMNGKWENQDPEEVYARAKALLDDPESGWVQVGYNPFRHSYFYDKNTTMPVASAEEVIQVGPLVLARGVKYNSKTDPIYATEGGGFYSSGGMVEEEMKAMGFSEGGLPERTVPYGDSTNPSDQLGDVEFRADMDDWLSNNAVARLGYDPKRSKVVNDSKHVRRLANYMLPATDRQMPYRQEVVDNMQGSYANMNMADEDVQRLDLDNVVLTGNMADQPVWSHEFTHRGFSELRKYLHRDPEKFRFKYGQEAFDALNTVTGRISEESRVEAYDDHSVREPKETPTFIQMKDTVDWVEKAKAKGEIPDPDEIYYDKEKRDSVKKTLSGINTVEGMKAYEEDEYKTDNLQVQLHRAATDLLRERGEPIREDQKQSFMDDLTDSAKEAVFNLFNK